MFFVVFVESIEGKVNVNTEIAKDLPHHPVLEALWPEMLQPKIFFIFSVFHHPLNG